MNINEAHHFNKKLIQFEKFKNFFVDEQTKNPRFFHNMHVFNENGHLLFAVEMFTFWMSAIESGTDSIDEFIKHSKENNIPVIDYDDNKLSAFGNDAYLIWKAALSNN